MKVLAILGSPRKGQTYKAVALFEQHLKAYGSIEFSYVFLNETNLTQCRGCALCLESGEEFCPVKDDRPMLVEKMLESDGVIFATPNYSLQVSALMKIFLDRLCFVFHRPCFFGKASMAIVTQGVYGAGDIVKYLNTIGDFWGFNVCPGVAVTTPWGVANPGTKWPQAEQDKISLKLKKAAERFYRTLTGTKTPEPGLKKLALFRLVRTGHKYSKEHKRDYNYYSDNGWFASPYYYDTKLSWYKKALGALIDKWMAGQSKKISGDKNSSK